jgi:mannose-6-phosphate isomerase-like protein (cupin superfamily)
VRKVTDSLKQWIFKRLKAEAQGFGLRILEDLSSAERPWGGFLRFSEESFQLFYDAYWQGIEVPQAISGVRLDPKILFVEPGKRLSLQYHLRRSEHWRILDGPVKIALGQSKSSLSEHIFTTGEVVRIPCGTWHRLEGLSTWGRVAEIWQSEDPDNPSDEDDIVRVEDDFGRTS